MKKIIIFSVTLCLLLMPLRVKAIGTSAKAAILINGDTGEVIYEQNADTCLPMASTTKIMTALLLCENGDFNREITVTDEMLRVEGSSMGLLAGDRVTLKALLYGMMLSSGNDAANVTAYVLGGTVDGFVRIMNQKAQELGLDNTHFETPSGLDGDEHYTSARDLAALARYAMQNESFREAAASKTATLEYGNPPYKRTLSNHNRLLKTFDGAIGVKTGFTKKSGRCLVSAADRDGKYVIAVTLCDPNDWADHSALLEYGLSRVTYKEINPKITDYEIPVISGEKEKLQISIEPMSIGLLDDSNLRSEVSLPRFLYAPIYEGDEVGRVVYKRGDAVLTSAPITAKEDIAVIKGERTITDKILENAKYIFLNLWEK